ncbi:hypothetical protein OZ411_11375 [Bradyrhizobium sp. Arg237L]|uniref:hypothetical protein n=1 Tax=Bradyrhizobium sp. Arg237L TaxID=3003352 RepID=UPI00249F509C|nr:hypothetical protein [Bradyrhizobium sp. Arg237L]MDI4233414.1 hypothetical protein [Bradyrhizobium sp. Arg237L]
MSSYESNERQGKASGTSSSFCTAGHCALCAAFSLLTAILLLSIIFVALEVPHGFESVSLRVLIRDTFSWTVVPLIVFVGEIVKSLFPWPIVIALAFGLIVWGPDRVRELLSSLKLEVPGVIKIDGTATDTFRKELSDARKTAGRTNKEIEEAYVAAKDYVVQIRKRHKIDALVGNLSSEVARIVGDTCPEDFRLTVHIPDLVFDDRLYQLVEYYDKRGEQVTKDKSGRAFSIRYGIIGRVWRSGVAEIEGELISAEDRALIKDISDVRELEKFIARRWGLTLDEAARIRPYQSYGAIRIERGDKPPGLVFFDSKVKNAFDGAASRNEIGRAVQESDLAVSLLEISREVSQFPRIQIFRSR